MLHTVEECDAEMELIDTEIERLMLEYRHVQEVREWLVSQDREKVEETLSSARKSKERLFEIVRDNPGISGESIFHLLEAQTLKERRTITFRLSDLRKSNRIENRGGSGKASRWFTKESS